MTIAAKLSELRAEKSAKEAAAQAAFWKLAHDLNDGVKVEIEEIEATIAAAGKTFEELTAGAETVASRRELQAKIDKEAALQAEKAAKEQELQKAHEAFRQAERLHEETTGPLGWRVNQINAELHAAHVAKEDLAQRCPYAWLRDRRAALLAERNHAHTAYLKAGRKYDECEADSRVSTVHGHLEADPLTAAEQLRTAAKAKLPGLKATRDAAKRELDRLEREIAELEAEMRKP